MNQETINKIKKEDKNALGRFAVIILLSMIVGAIIGVGSVQAEKFVEKMAIEMTDFIRTIAPYGIFGITCIAMIFVVILMKKSRKLYQSWDGENEEQINQIEAYLSYTMWINSINMILVYFLFAAGLSSALEEPYKITAVIRACLLLGGFILSVVCIILSQQRIVNFEKEINPEKSGSVYDVKFLDKWEKSCDEAERLLIYKSAYKSYRSVNMTCIVLWLFCTLGSFIWNIGLLPVAIVSIIWFVQVTSYCTETIRLSKQSLIKK